jgi:hypothetical protein
MRVSLLGLLLLLLAILSLELIEELIEEGKRLTGDRFLGGLKA